MKKVFQVISRGEDSSDKIDITKNEFYFGRASDCAVRITNDSVSRFHAKVYVKNGSVYIEDNSSNGTFINNQRLNKKESQKITHKDQIRLGKYNVIFKVKHFNSSGPDKGADVVQFTPPSARMAEFSAAAIEGNAALKYDYVGNRKELQKILVQIDIKGAELIDIERRLDLLKENHQQLEKLTKEREKIKKNIDDEVKYAQEKLAEVRRDTEVEVKDRLEIVKEEVFKRRKSMEEEEELRRTSFHKEMKQRLEDLNVEIDEKREVFEKELKKREQSFLNEFESRKNDAEKEASQIIEQAKQEAESITAKACEEAEIFVSDLKSEAQKEANQAISQADEYAQSTVEDSNRRANEMISNAEKAAEDIVGNAESMAKQTMDDAEQKIQILQDEIENLSTSYEEKKEEQENYLKEAFVELQQDLKKEHDAKNEDYLKLHEEYKAKLDQELQDIRETIENQKQQHLENIKSAEIDLENMHKQYQLEEEEARKKVQAKISEMDMSYNKKKDNLEKELMRMEKSQREERVNSLSHNLFVYTRELLKQALDVEDDSIEKFQEDLELIVKETLLGNPTTLSVPGANQFTEMRKNQKKRAQLYWFKVVGGVVGAVALIVLIYKIPDMYNELYEKEKGSATTSDYYTQQVAKKRELKKFNPKKKDIIYKTLTDNYLYSLHFQTIMSNEKVQNQWIIELNNFFLGLDLHENSIVKYSQLEVAYSKKYKDLREKITAENPDEVINEIKAAENNFDQRLIKVLGSMGNWEKYKTFRQIFWEKKRKEFLFNKKRAEKKKKK